MTVKQTRILMGMPVTVEIVNQSATQTDLDDVFRYFEYVDEKFSTYKECSEISRLNRKEIRLDDASLDMRTIFALADETRIQTDGYFDIRHNDSYDPSGLVKGWAIFNASQILRSKGFENFYVDAGGDVQVYGDNNEGMDWRVGIRNPFNPREIVKVLAVRDCGVATSGTDARGQHIYNPRREGSLITEVMSITVIGPDIYEADRFATAAFAMGREGIVFIEKLEGFESYLIDQDKLATFTSGFERYIARV